MHIFHKKKLQTKPIKCPLVDTKTFTYKQIDKTSFLNI